MRILIADDHAVFRVGLRQLLGELGRDLEIIEAGTAKEAMAALGRTRFDLALIDLDMPGMNSEEIAQLAAATAGLQLVGLSDNLDPISMRRALGSGFAGYLPKAARPEVIVSALQIILSGERYAPVATFDGAEAAAKPSGAAAARARHAPLTSRQRDIMQLLAQGRQNRDIAQFLGVAEGTVKAHVANIFKALKVNNRTAAAAAAQKLGLLP